MISSLVSLVKLGALGTSLAFLITSYYLLAEEQKLKDRSGNPASPRPAFLAAIAKFRQSALAFLIVGIAADFLLTRGEDLISVFGQTFSNDKFVRVRFDAWGYSKSEKKIEFSVVENRINIENFVLPALKGQYDVYIAVRKKDTTPILSGTYPLHYGPYSISSYSFDPTLTDDQIRVIGDKCILMVAFGIPRIDGKQTKVGDIFAPDAFETKAKVFNYVTVCSE